MDLHDWRSSSCRCERLGVLLFTFWQVVNKSLPLGFVAQHSPAAFGKLCRCFVNLDICNSGNKGPGPRTVLPSLQPLRAGGFISGVLTLLIWWDPQIVPFLTPSGISIPHSPAPRHSEVINCGKFQGKNHQCPLNLPKNKALIYERICSTVTEQKFFYWIWHPFHRI